MPANAETQNKKLHGFLQANEFNKLTARDENGEPVLDLGKAVEFSFQYKFNNQDLSEVTITADNGEISVYYTNKVTDPNKDTQWSNFLIKLKQWGIRNGFSSFKFNNNLSKLLMYRQQKKKQKMESNLLEGYYGTKNTSYSDSTPVGIKMIIKHNRSLEETDQRYRYVERIFLETERGERLLLNTKKPSIARAFARHLAEGGEYNDERWRHINEIAEDIGKLAGFVRATHHNQFNESVQQIVNETLAHYTSLRETIRRIQGSRGYSAYFENWQPKLMEQGPEQDYMSIFQTSRLDPRIEQAIPVLQKLNIRINDLAETREFEAWADSIVEGQSPEQDAKIDRLAKLLKQEKIPVGADGISLKAELQDMIDDQTIMDEISDELDELSYADPDLDAKPAIMSVVLKHSGDNEFFREVNRKIETGDIKSSSGTELQKAVTKEPAPSAKPAEPGGAGEADKFMPLPEAVEDLDEKKQPSKPPQRNFVAKHAQKSGAGAHGKPGYQRHPKHKNHVGEEVVEEIVEADVSDLVRIKALSGLK
jgi:hypothetical protein